MTKPALITLAAVVAALARTGNAQVATPHGPSPTVSVNVEAVSTGKAGYTTYQVGVRFGPKARDVYAIFGSTNDPLVLPPAFQVAAPFGSQIGPANAAFIPINPDVEFDSWLTVGIDGPALTPGALSSVGLDLDAWTETAGISAENGAIFFMDPDHGAVTEPVVFAQLTVRTGTTITGQVSAQGRSSPSNGQAVDDWEVQAMRFSSAPGGAQQPPPPPATETGRQCSDRLDNDGDGLADCADPDCATDRRCANGNAGNGGFGGRPPPPPCHGIVAPPRSFTDASAVIGVLVDPQTELESALLDDGGKPCTLTLPCNMDGFAAITAICPLAQGQQVPSSCPAGCSELVDPWYTECDAMDPAAMAALDVSLNGAFVRFVETCDARLQAPVVAPPPPPAPNGVVGGETGRQCADQQDNDGDGIMDCDDPDCADSFMCTSAMDAVRGIACHGIVAPAPTFGGRGRRLQGFGGAPTPQAVIGVLTDPTTGRETALFDATGRACTLTLPCSAEGWTAISAICPGFPASCSTDCSEIVDPWYTECRLTNPNGMLELDQSLGGTFLQFADRCDPRLQAPVYVPPPPPPPAPTAESGRQCTDGIDNDGDGSMDCDDPDCTGDRRCARCNGILAPPRQFGSNTVHSAVIGVIVDPNTRAESSLLGDNGAVCTLTLPCNVDGLAAISDICPTASTGSMLPSSCPAACSEIVDPWYTECVAMDPAAIVTMDTSLNGQFVRWAETCDPRLQAPVVQPPPPNGVVGGETGRQCSDQQDNDGDGIMDCDDPDCYDDRRCQMVGFGAPCNGVTPPRGGFGGRGRRLQGFGGGPPPPPMAVIGVLVDPETGLESALRNDQGKACTLQLPCSVEGLAALSAVCPPAVGTSQVPSSCPAACSELVDPWYKECLAASPDTIAAIDAQLNGEFRPFVLTCNPGGWGH
jgi:hypothetical protein